MNSSNISQGTVHEVPKDMLVALTKDKPIFDAWQSLTPLARNEWICWVITVKQQKTRDEHIKRMSKELKEGKRRPCCWMGCIHRTDKEISPSVKGILSKKQAKK